MFWANEFVLDLNLERHHTNMIKAGSAKGEGLRCRHTNKHSKHQHFNVKFAETQMQLPPHVVKAG